MPHLRRDAIMHHHSCLYDYIAYCLFRHDFIRLHLYCVNCGARNFVMIEVLKSFSLFESERERESKSVNVFSFGAESWIELSAAATMAGIKSPDRFTPLPFSSGEEYLRLLREAQRESNNSSRVVSLASSSRASSHDR